tara:strand:- start:1790 stop:2944 length:1155 start_codon:yes stop_codon:yes gene_type:complete
MKNNIVQTYKLLKSLSFKRASSDVMTPIDLALQMVDAIPQGLFNGKVLIPGSGYGTFAMALIHRGWDPAMITCVEIDKAFALVSQKYVGRYGVNVIKENFLSWQTNMQFDVVIGNPPYQDSNAKAKANKLWPKFIKVAIGLLKPNGFLSFITPSSFVTSTTRIGKTVRKDLTSSFNIKKVEDANEFFSVGVDVCRWRGVKEDYSFQTEVNGVIADLTEAHLTGDDLIFQSIFDKVTDKSITKLPLKTSNQHVTKDDIVDEGGTNFLYSGSKVKQVIADNIDAAGIPKFIAPWSSSWRGVFHTTLPTSQLNAWFECSEEDFESYAHIWKLNIVKVMCDKYRKTCGFTPAVINKEIPDFRGMTNEDTYKVLGLTSEEIALVKAHCS